MSDYKEKLEVIEKTVNERKLEKAKLDERKKTLEEEEKKLNEELKECGIENSVDLEKWLEEEKKKLDEKIKEVYIKLGLEE